jgi:hypothetical protein
VLWPELIPELGQDLDPEYEACSGSVEIAESFNLEDPEHPDSSYNFYNEDDAPIHILTNYIDIGVIRRIKV